jgi:transcription regulator MmyB-like protein
MFQHPQARVVFVEWSILVEQTVHALRLNAGYYPNDPEIRALVEEFLETSPEFRALWQDQGVGGLTRTYKGFVHPEVGRVELTYQTEGPEHPACSSGGSPARQRQAPWPDCARSPTVPAAPSRSRKRVGSTRPNRSRT